MFNNKNEAKWFVIIFQMIILFSILGVIIYSYISGMLSSNNFFIILIIVLLMGIPVFVNIRVKLNQKKNQNKKFDEIQENKNTVHDTDKQYDNNIQHNNSAQQNINSTFKGDDSQQKTFGSRIKMMYQSGGKSSTESKKTANSKWPAMIPIVVLGFIAIYTIFGNPLDMFNIDNNPTGKWYLDFDVSGGNLTEYQFYQFYEDGTLDVGTKVSGSAEYIYSGSQGTWYISDGIIYVSHKQWNGTGYSTINFQVKMRDNKLYSLEGIDTGLRRTSKWVN